MLDKSAFLSKIIYKCSFLHYTRKEVRAVPDVPWVHMDDPPDSGVGVIAGMPASVKINVLLTTLEKRK
jgi:hypothetical protein